MYWFQENLQHWLTDEKARDQFVIRAGSDTEVLWNDARQLKPDPVYKRPVSDLKFVVLSVSSGSLLVNLCCLMHLILDFTWMNCPCTLLNTFFSFLFRTSMFYVSLMPFFPHYFFTQFWTESFVQWSPLGTYLATLHRQGAVVWGGASAFNRLTRYAHPQVIF